MLKKLHEPVLLKEAIEALHIENPTGAGRQGRYIDATLGAGGYTNEISKKGGIVLGIDTDESMLKIARNSIAHDIHSTTLVHGNFKNIAKIAKENGFDKVDGIVFDLGISNVHFLDSKRGFSFRNPKADLDMRLDPKSQNLKASDLLNILREDQLTEILGKNLAKKVVEFRKTQKFEKVGDLLSLFPEKKNGKLHPATLAFMNLRIAVNSELDNLQEALPQAIGLLKPGGKLVVVSFHSLEDRIVKSFFNNNKFVRPSDEEIKRNPKSRSAIMRVYEN